MPRGRFSNVDGLANQDVRQGKATTESRRRQILEAAVSVMCERGFGDTRIAQIAERAGLSGGTIIYHFRTLDSLLVAALAHSENEFYSAAERAVAEATGPREQLSRLVTWALRPEPHTDQLWILWLEMWSEAPRHPAVAKARSEGDVRWRRMIADIAAASGKTRERVDRFAVTFAALIDGLAIQVVLEDAEMAPSHAIEIATSFAVNALDL